MSRDFEIAQAGLAATPGTSARLLNGSEQLQPNSIPVKESPLAVYLQTLWNRKWMILCVTALGTAAMALFSALQQPVYEGVAQIGIYKDSPGALNVKQEMPAGTTEESDYTVALDTQAKIIEGDGIASEVIANLGLEHNPHFIKKAATAVNSQNGTNYKVALLKFHNSLRVIKVPHTRLLELRFSSTDPKLAADVANALADAYIDHTFDVQRETTIQATKRLSQELATLEEATKQSEAKLVAYQQTHRMVGSTDLVAARLAELNKNLTEVETQKTQKEAEYRLIMAAKQPDIVQTVQPNGLLEQLRNRESQLSTEYAKLSASLGPAHPQLIGVKNQLDDVRASIQNELRRMVRRAENDYGSLNQREAWLRNALAAEEHNSAQQNQDAIEYNNLKRDADSNRQVFTDLQLRLKEAQLAAGLRADNIRIEAPATIPQRPSKPDIPVNLGLGFFASLAIGIGLVLVLEDLDTSIRSAEEAQSISGAMALGVIPNASKLNRTAVNSSGLIAPAASQCAGLVPHDAEPYRALRSLLLLSYASPRVLLVTSSLPGEGKTTTAINMATTFAQSGRRVLLIDADMRKAAMDKNFPYQEGLSEVLRGELDAAQVIVRSPNTAEKLFVLTAGTPVSDTTDLLGGSRLQQLLQVVKAQFDHVIIDTPPVLGVTDTLLMTSCSDAVLLVVRQSITPRQALARTRELLARANAINVSVVLNGVTGMNLPGYGYGSSYRYHSSRIRSQWS